MTETATLKVNVIETGANKVRVNIDRVAKSCEEAAKQAGYFFDKQGRLRTQNGQFAKSNDEVANSLRRMKKQSDALGDSIDDLDDKSKKGGTALGALKGIAASFLTFKTIENAVKMADTMTVLRSQVNLVTKSQEESIAVQSQLFDISTRTYASLEATTTLYTRTARALQHLNKSSTETLKFTEAINNAMRLGGVSASEQASALLQLSQAMGSGVLQGDEFRSLAENAPMLLDILAKHMGVLRGELKQMGSDGKITSEVIFEAMSKASDDLSKKAASIPVTFGQSMQVMKTHVMAFADSMMNGSGIMTAVAAAVITLAKNIGYVLVPAMGIAGVFAIKGLIAAFTMLGGPMGIIAVVIGALGMLAVAWSNNAKKLDDLRSKVRAAYDDIEEMSKTKLDAFMVNLEIVISHDAKNYKDAQDKLKGMENRLVSLNKRYEELRKSGGNVDSISKLMAKLSDEIVLQKARLEELGGVYSSNLDMQKQGLILQGKGGANPFMGPLPYKESKAFVEAMEDYAAAQKLIGLEGEKLKIETKIQSGELKNMSSTEIERLRTEAQITDEMRKQQGLLTGMQSTVDRIMDNYVLSTLNDHDGLVYSLTREGFSEEDANIYADIQGEADRNNKAKAKLAKSSSGGGSNPFTDRLKSLSEEAAKLQAVNAEIRKYGEAGRYTALQEITLELENQNGALRGISATQKQMLLDQAALLDNQRQANEVLTLGSDYSKQIEDMNFELGLIGKTSSEIEDLRFNRELELKVRAIANGASKETIELLTQEIAKIRERKAAYDASKGDIDSSAIGGISEGFKNYLDEAGTVRDQWADTTKFAFESMTDGFADFASGTKTNFGDMTESILRDITRMIVKMSILNAMESAFGGGSDSGIGKWFGGLFGGGKANGGIVGYANGGAVDLARQRGGFTGFGSKYEPADIVHKGEVVWSQADVARHGGLSQVERMRKGYALGGVVGSMYSGQHASSGMTVNIHNNSSAKVETRQGTDSNGMPSLDVFINQVASEIDKRISNGGSTAKILQGKYGLRTQAR